MNNEFQQVSDERYEIIMNRYAKFQEAMEYSDLKVVKVFDKLNQKQIEELELIREVSKDLQKKKEEDMNKAKQAEADAKATVKEEGVKEEEVKEEQTETEEKKE